MQLQQRPCTMLRRCAAGQQQRRVLQQAPAAPSPRTTQRVQHIMMASMAKHLPQQQHHHHPAAMPSLAAAGQRQQLAVSAPPGSSSSRLHAYRGREDDWGSSSSSNGVPDPPPLLNPLEAVKRELGTQSNRLDTKVKEAVEVAIARCGYTATVGQVAAAAGVKLSDADAALKALAYDSLANLQVSEAGEVIYVFDRDFASTIRRRSWLQRLRPAWRRVVSGANYLARLAFGSALIVSALVAWLGVAVLLSSGRDNDRRGGGGYYGGPRGYVFFDPTDILLIWDPSYGRHSRARADSGEGMTFVEAVFSWVFGDGDPNATYEERRWRALGAHIQRLGGVVSAEELAPFLDPPPLKRGRNGAFPRGAEKYGDESFVLPALLRFNGEPFVDNEGRLLYRFPDLQVVAGGAPELRLTAAEARVPLEREWEFSVASPGQQAGALLLGVVNVIGVVTLSTLLVDPLAKLALYRQGLGFLLGLLPYLQAYAGAFFALPALRAFVDGRRNVAIQARNDTRLEAVELLQSGDSELAAKSAAARKLGGSRVIGRRDVVYTTELATDEQADAAEAREFERKLAQSQQQRGGGRQQQQQQQQRQLPAGRGNRIDDVFGRRRQQQQQPSKQRQEIEVEWPGSQQQQQQQRRQQQRQQRDDWDRW